jgi:Glucose / Sorbosone dehydrogenase
VRTALLALAVALATAAPANAAPRLVKVGDFSQPVHVASPPNDPRVFVVEKGGLVKIVGGGTFLDVRASTDSNEEERGLLSIAFPPNYASSGYFYVFRTAANPDGQLQVVEFRRSADPNRADPGSGRVVLRIDHDRENHNGGQLQFGPDGYLYVGTGDGGGANDPDENGQDTTTELGKILRIVAHTGGAAPGNPFGNRVWMYGLRNPWRFTFDRLTHDLVIGDVGQDRWEEVDWARYPGLGKGVNFGWSCREGFHSNNCTTTGWTDPVFELAHDDGFQAVVGGYVVRDPGLPTLRGRYLYGDTYQPTLYSVALPNSGNRTESALKIQTLSSFGQDACGRIYAASLNGPVYRLQDGAATPCSFGGKDTTAPAVKVSLAGVKNALKKRRLLVRIRCSEACRASVGTRLIKVKRLTTRHRSIAAGARVTVKVKLYKKVAKKLRRRVNRKGFVRIGVTVRATDLAGNARVKHRHGRIRKR